VLRSLKKIPAVSALPDFLRFVAHAKRSEHEDRSDYRADRHEEEENQSDKEDDNADKLNGYVAFALLRLFHFTVALFALHYAPPARVKFWGV
jgi:hypothetical protein